MPLHRDTRRWIQTVEELSGRPVHVTEDPNLKIMSTITTARGSAPAHFLRYRPDTQAVDYLVAYQLGFLVRLFSCPEDDRWEISSSPDEQQRGIIAMGLGGLPEDLGKSLIGNIVTQLRSFSVGARVDDWIWKNMPDLWSQQEHSIRSQLEEHAMTLAPDIRQRLPKPLIDANASMNAAYAVLWAPVLGEPQFSIPFKALGYTDRAKELLEILETTPDSPRSDRLLIEGWAKCLGLGGAFHFKPHVLT